MRSSREHAINEPEEDQKAIEERRLAKRHGNNKFLKFYDTQYRKLLFIPIIMLVVAILLIGIQTATTGDFVNKGVSLKGGLTMTIVTDEYIDVDELQIYLSQQFPTADISARAISELGKTQGILIDASLEVNETELITALKPRIDDIENKISVEFIGPVLGDAFFKQTIFAMLIAFVCMGIVVFAYFKTLVPSGAVILAAFSDIVVTLAVVNLIGMKMTTGGIAAFLMLIGYSVDTDILLTSRVLKRKVGTIFERIISAMKTGLTMNVTTMAAIIVAMVFTSSESIRQIMTILLIGLLADIINTWLQNAAIIRWYAEKKKPESK